MMTFISRSESSIVLLRIILWLILPVLLFLASETRADKAERLLFIDTSAHLHGALPMGRSDFEGAAGKALRAMDEAGIRQTILLPPPFTYSHRSRCDEETLRPIAKSWPNHFLFMAGGGSLSPMLIDAVKSGEVSADLKKSFAKTAKKVAASGAVGFGEIALEHFGLGPNHKYEYVPPDHPLMLILADIAAEQSIPIFVHLEAIEHEAPIADQYASFGNPGVLKPNIKAFERLLAHNRKTLFVWAQLGWDHTGQRTPGLMERLFSAHSNLFAAVKIGPDSLPENRPLSRGQGMRPEWMQLIEKFPDRVMLGSDQFYTAPDPTNAFTRVYCPCATY
jgi:hypothetical protein